MKPKLDPNRPAAKAFRARDMEALRAATHRESVVVNGMQAYKIDADEPLAQRMRDMFCICGDYIGTELMVYAPAGETSIPKHARCAR